MRRKERNEAHLYMTVNVLLEDAFDGHQGNDLYDPEKANYRVFRIKKLATVRELLQILAENFNYKIAQIRPWPFSARTNHVSINLCFFCLIENFSLLLMYSYKLFVNYRLVDLHA